MVLDDPRNVKVLVLEGGSNEECDTSLNSSNNFKESLSRLGYNFSSFNPKLGLESLKQELDETKPDVVFNALHGRHYEDGDLQDFLDPLGVRYTHSCAKASRLAMNKVLTSNLAQSVGIRIPESKVCSLAELRVKHPISPPYVIKPTNSGSSVGVHKVFESDELPEIINLPDGSPEVRTNLPEFAELEPWALIRKTVFSA